MAQNNLGNALWTIGERESSAVRLEEAVAACRAALEEWTRERVPLQWATDARAGAAAMGDGAKMLVHPSVKSPPVATQNNLGNALFRLGERESGAVWLQEAVAAYPAALEEWDICLGGSLF
jgi:tetratricopeptide (TPR) repeat protein